MDAAVAGSRRVAEALDGVAIDEVGGRLAVQDTSASAAGAALNRHLCTTSSGFALGSGHTDVNSRQFELTGLLVYSTRRAVWVDGGGLLLVHLSHHHACHYRLTMQARLVG